MNSSIITTKITKEQAISAGMALILISLILGFLLKNDLFFKLAIPITVITMTVPMLFYPFAVFWFSLSNLLGTITSKIILSLVFFVVVSPISIIRMLFRRDPLKIRKFKKDTGSVLVIRNHIYTDKDIEKPY